MKRITSIVLSLAIVVGLFLVPVTAHAENKTFQLKIGETYTGEVDEGISMYGISMTSYTDTYTFTMNESANIGFMVAKDDNASISWRVRSSDYDISYSSQSAPSTGIYYLPKGKTYSLILSGNGKYGVRTQKLEGDKLKLNSKSGKLAEAKKTVGFTFTGTSGYAKDNLSVKSSKTKVATVEYQITGENSGTFTITPKNVGKTTITLKMKGGNTVKYTANVTKGYWFVVKGSKAKAPKPTGVKSPTWKSSKKKVLTVNKKTGKVKAKKGGRTVLTAKKGKTSYDINTVVTDYIKLGKKAYKQIKNTVNNPEKLKIYNVYRGYSKLIYDGVKVPVIHVDYGSTNENGAMVRSKINAYYDDVYEIHYTSGWNIDTIIGKKKIKASKIK